MKLIIINKSQVRELLSMEECVQLMEEAFKSLSLGDASMPLRSVMLLPDKTGVMGMMPAVNLKLKAMGIKIVSVFPGNSGTEFDTHQGAVLLFDTDHGQPKALVDGISITSVRTAAVSAVATDVLARKDADDLAILGSGTQAVMHLESMMLVRKIRRVRVWSLPLEHARQYAEHATRQHGLQVEVMENAQDTVKGADIICTLTPAAEPVLQGKWIKDGAHINAVGACVPTSREIDTECVVRSRLFADCRESTLNEAGDFLIPRKEGAIGDNHILGELGDILLGKCKGRQSDSDITLFESLGLGLQDLVSAQYIYNKALEKGVGQTVEL